MVRALLEGRKTQTRRVVKPQPVPFSISACPENHMRWTHRGEVLEWICFDGEPATEVMRRGMRQFCPYGVPGDRLWVREAWYYDLPPHKLPSAKPADFDPDSLYFRADGDCCQQIPECQCAEVGKPKWKPSIHLPRWASRITREITDVRVERVQEISEEDAEAEGCEPNHIRTDTIDTAYRAGYARLWDSINGVGSWAANPWVWAVTFKAVPA